MQFSYIRLIPVPGQPPYKESKNVQPYQNPPTTPAPPDQTTPKELKSYEHHSYTPNKARKEEQWRELEALVEKGLFDNGKSPSESLKVRSFPIFASISLNTCNNWSFFPEHRKQFAREQAKRTQKRGIF